MTSFQHRPFEQVLGFYDIGDTFVIYANPYSQHQHYVSVHESTHASIGWSSSFGVFQKLLAGLVDQDTERLSDVAREMLTISCDAIRELHESTATFCQFNAAEFADYSRISEMKEGMPDEYVQWLSIYDDVFQDCIPVFARGILARLIASCSMNTRILNHYRFLTHMKISEFSEYICVSENSPGKRFRIFLEVIKGGDQSQLFHNFLDKFAIFQDELIESYRSRSYDDRKASLKIQKQLTEAFDCPAPV